MFVIIEIRFCKCLCCFFFSYDRAISLMPLFLSCASQLIYILLISLNYIEEIISLLALLWLYLDDLAAPLDYLECEFSDFLPVFVCIFYSESVIDLRDFLSINSFLISLLVFITLLLILFEKMSRKSAFLIFNNTAVEEETKPLYGIIFF